MLGIKKHFFVSLVFVAFSAVFLLGGCSKKEEQTAAEPATEQQTAVKVKIGATPVPHVEILEFAKPLLAEQGIELEIVTFTDYVQPNLALDKGDLDANYFQHFPYLESFSADNRLDLTAIAKVHIEPIGFYSTKIADIDQVKDGDVIGIPNDPTNGGRALALLEKAGLITLKEGVGVKATVQDITDNPKKLNIKTLDAAQLPRALPDVAGAVINTNFALEAGLNPSKDALFIEDKDSPYANILVVKTSRADEETLQKVAAVLASDAVNDFILEKYRGAVVPAQEVIAR